jgi:hypothetical protein
MLKYLKPVFFIVGLFLAMWIAFGLEKPAPKAVVASSPTAVLLAEDTNPSSFSYGGDELAPVSPTELPTATLEKAPAPKAAASTAVIPAPTAIPTPLPVTKPAAAATLPPQNWKDWPVMPTVSDAMRQLYQRSVAQGLVDPHAFSVFGDCQSEADAFLGVYDTSPALVKTMASDLQATVAQFSGSFNRYNPAAKSGSSAGALLYAPWNDNLEGKCLKGETPVDCELRVHHPSIVFVHVGTHFEASDRNYLYLSTIIEKVMATGAVPVMVTKADNLDKDGHVNQNITLLAAKYGLPLWNFWASVQSLPDGGLLPDGMHLTADGTTIHQVGALRVLGAVWRAVQ